MYAFRQEVRWCIGRPVLRLGFYHNLWGKNLDPPFHTHLLFYLKGDCAHLWLELPVDYLPTCPQRHLASGHITTPVNMELQIVLRNTLYATLTFLLHVDFGLVLDPPTFVPQGMYYLLLYHTVFQTHTPGRRDHHTTQTNKPAMHDGRRCVLSIHYIVLIRSQLTLPLANI